MEIPVKKTIVLSQAERFIEGLTQLRKECGITKIEYNAFGINKFHFKDGSYISNVRAFINAGYIDEEIYRKKFIDK